ncbi:DUF1801 domain-containing protein [Cryobacterium cryoconiti]|uniref:DUF1801 domain-containing protein n=1 Tax=Cryobacterium cryoconiti TaxID=1259239 RepID=A0A4Y8JYW2_9MICO|nr:DUF1801 domain-containing protein [Cryobacterium cryoconiti]TFD29858.1 DUF1801 domain-containing protein [Cryobacterium cryoconiti]
MAVTYRTVAEFLVAQPPDRRAEIEVLRQIVLGTNGELSEHIKWNSPSYVLNGVDRVTVNAHGKGVRLILHWGTRIAEDRRAAHTFDGDPFGLLTWHSNIRASVSVADLADLLEKQDQISDVVRRWLDAAR